jgi:hypothetical protein
MISEKSQNNPNISNSSGQNAFGSNGNGDFSNVRGGISSLNKN